MSYDQDTQDAAEVRLETRRRPSQGPQPGDVLGQRQRRLWEAAETLDNALDTLTHRITPVLLPERAEGALSGIAGDADANSELGGYLDQLLDKLERLARRTSTTAERVDL
jgi:hypothetical protein